MKNQWKKAAALGLSTCLALGALSGCSKKNEFDASKTAITVNGDEISVGLVKFASHYIQAQYETLYANFGYTGIINQDLYGNGTTLGDSLKSSMQEELKQMLLAEQHMEEYGVTLSDEQKKAASDAAAAFLEENDAELLENMSADQETVERYLILQAKKALMEDAMVADVDTEVSDEDAAQRRLRYTVFTAAAETEAETEEVTEAETDGAAVELESEAAETASLTENDTTKTQTAGETETETAVEETEVSSTEAVTEAGEEASTEEETETETEDPVMVEAKAKARVKAEALIEKVKAGEDFETASAEVDEDAYCGTMTFGENDAETRAELLEATNGLADGTLVETPVETDSGYYVALVEAQIDREATDERKEEIIEERKSERREELYTEWEEAAEITDNDEILSEIKFEFSLTLATEAESEMESEYYMEAESGQGMGETEAAELVSENGAAESETETGTVAEAGTETENVTETEVETESVAETGAETESVAETETDVPAEESESEV